MADKHAYWDWTNDYNVRRRLIMTPKGTTPLSRSGAPAFGAGSSGVWLRAPDDSLYSDAIELPEVGFDALPVGWPDAAAASFKFNLTPLDLGSADEQAVVDQLLDPQYDYPAGVALSYAAVLAGAGPALEIWPGSAYRRINTANMLTLLCDDGDASLGVGSFRVEFQGPQLVEPNAPTSHLIGAHPEEPWDVSIVSVPTILAIAEAVVPNDVAIRLDFSSADVAHEILLDTPWKISSLGYARVIGSYPLSTSREVYQMFLWADLFTAIRDLIQSAYRQFIRDNSATFLLGFTGGGVGSQFGPYEFMRKRPPNFASGGGADLSGTNLDWRFPGFCYPSDDVSHTPFGGYLHDDGGNESTLYAYDSMYQYLKEMTEQCVAIARIVPTTSTALAVVFAGTRQTSPELDVSPEDIRSVGYPITTGAEIVTSGTCTVLGMQSGDKPDVSYRASTRADTNPREVPQPWSNCPAVGEFDPHWYYERVDSGTGLTTKMVGSPCKAWNTLWAIDSAAGLFSPGKPVRMHHYVGISDGVTNQEETTNGIALPNPGVVVGAANYQAYLWGPVRLAMLAMQNQGCMSNASCRRMATEFGRSDQSTYEGSVDAWRAAPANLGLRCGADFATAEDLTGRARSAVIPGRPHLLKTAVTTRNDIAKVTLFALGEE